MPLPAAPLLLLLLLSQVVVVVVVVVAENSLLRLRRLSRSVSCFRNDEYILVGKEGSIRNSNKDGRLLLLFGCF